MQTLILLESLPHPSRSQLGAHFLQEWNTGTNRVQQQPDQVWALRTRYGEVTCPPAGDGYAAPGEPSEGGHLFRSGLQRRQTHTGGERAGKRGVDSPRAPASLRTRAHFLLHPLPSRVSDSNVLTTFYLTSLPEGISNWAGAPANSDPALSRRLRNWGRGVGSRFLQRSCFRLFPVL